VAASAVEFYKMLQDLNQQQHYVDQIAKNEEEADQIAHQTFELLHKTFITPFDRYDIHHLTGSLDDILDQINRCAQRFPFYHLAQVPPEMIQLAGLSAESMQALKEAIYALSSLKNADIIFQRCDEIDRVEGKAHKVVLAGEKKLFLEENDFKQFFKLKEIYSHTKSVINRSQDVANIVKGIVLEYS
jgi:predicted phosphate transport protein (TIGR00153 family)